MLILFQTRALARSTTLANLGRAFAFAVIALSAAPKAYAQDLGANLGAPGNETCTQCLQGLQASVTAQGQQASADLALPGDPAISKMFTEVYDNAVKMSKEPATYLGGIWSPLQNSDEFFPKNFFPLGASSVPFSNLTVDPQYSALYPASLTGGGAVAGALPGAMNPMAFDPSFKVIDPATQTEIYNSKVGTFVNGYKPFPNPISPTMTQLFLSSDGGSPQT